MKDDSRGAVLRFVLIFLFAILVFLAIVLIPYPYEHSMEIYPVFSISEDRIIYIDGNILKSLELNMSEVKFINSSKKSLVVEYDYMSPYRDIRRNISITLYYPDRPD